MRLIQQVHTDNIPIEINKDIEQYLHDDRIGSYPIIKKIKLLNDYMITVKALYPKSSDNIRKRLREYIVKYLKRIMRSDGDATLVLSKAPTVRLQYKWLDKFTIMYRFKVIRNTSISEWKSETGYHAKEKVARAVFDLLVGVAGFNHLNEPQNERSRSIRHQIHSKSAL